jgi:hypothetical protein
MVIYVVVKVNMLMIANDNGLLLSMRIHSLDLKTDLQVVGYQWANNTTISLNILEITP